MSAQVAVLANIANAAAHIPVDEKRDRPFTCDFGCLFVLLQHLPAFFYFLRGSPQAGLESFGTVKKRLSRTTSTIERTQKTLNKEKKMLDDSCSKRNLALGLFIFL
jgi:hypothetical protein